MIDSFSEKSIVYSFLNIIRGNDYSDLFRGNEPPDFTCKIDNKRIGIELTSYFNDNNYSKKYPSQEEEVMRKKIVNDAYGYYKEKGIIEDFQLSIYFHENIQLSSRQRLELSKQIAEYVDLHAKKISTTSYKIKFVNFPIFGRMRDSLRLENECLVMHDELCSKFINFISIRKSNNIVWSSGNDLSFWLQDVSTQSIRKIIEDKENKIKGFFKERNRYLTIQRCKEVLNLDQIVLLIHANENAPSSNVNVTDALLNSVFITDFDAVYFYQVAFSKKVWGLTTKKPE